MRRDSSVDMTYGGSLRHIVSFALPLFFGNIFQQLYNTADCFVVGHFLGRDALAAIGSTSQLVFTVIGFFGGFSTGAQVVISQLFGAKDVTGMGRAVHTAIASSFAISVFMTLLSLLVTTPVLRLINVPEEAFPLAQSYLRIYFSGTPFLILYNMGSGILRALGDSKRPLIFLVISSLLNIALDFVFVALFRLGVDGAAWATVISEAVSLVLVFSVLLFTKGAYKVNLKKLRIDVPLLSQMLKIGLPGALSSSLTAFSNTFLQKYVNDFGPACTAGWAVFARFDQLAIMPMMSISLAATTFVSQNFGAGKMARIWRGMRISFALILSITAAISIVLIVLARFLSGLFVGDEESAGYAVLFIRYTSPFYILCATTMLLSQILRGIGDSIAPTAITFSGFILFRQFFLLAAARFFPSFSLVAAAYPLAWVLTSICMVLYFGKAAQKTALSKNGRKLCELNA